MTRRDFLAQGSGGPANYTGRSMLDAHRGMNISGEEYLAAVERRPKALNHAMYIGHSGLRMYVMGRRALTDRATDLLPAVQRALDTLKPRQ